MFSILQLLVYLMYIDPIQMPLPNQPVQKMSISYLMEPNDRQEDDQLFTSLPDSSGSSLPSKICRPRKRQHSVTSIMSPAHTKPRLFDQPLTDTTDLPTKPSVGFEDPGSPTADDVRRALEAQIAPSKKKVRSICEFYYYYVEKLIPNVSSR